MSELTSAHAGPRLNEAIANAIVRGHRRYIGRGPSKAQALYRHNVIVVVMRDSLTTSERSLAADGREEDVLGMRRLLQGAMRGQLVDAVEELTGCKVEAAMSGSQIHPDLATELFVLDRPVRGQQLDDRTNGRTAL